ncbi:SDR family oxidoreductase [Luteimonas composti]|uniref:SDR family oxidoreductase n=1 Tax=Luteimonas composti TaxID=398257 RepID=A0ABT6MNQ8_9GAMM|nr:SDR family oxidoreductase [Luteimonas composti]MDH7452217.1 SDR family oxidoreductase [Luteimonas composti]
MTTVADSGAPGVAGKVLLVTGATSGIGLQCARSLAEAGAKVILTGRRQDRVDAAAALLAGAGLDIEAHVLDVTVEADWLRAVAAAKSAFGRLDGILSNAGECVLAPIDQLDPASVQRQLKVNVVGTFLALKHGLPAVRESGGGQIVAVGSVAGLRPAANSTVYSASKAALVDLVRFGATEGAARQPSVQVFGVHPGMIAGEGAIEAFGAERAKAMQDAIAAQTPVGRIGLPEDVSRLVQWIFSNEASPCSGAQFVIDGGFSMR